MYYIGRKLAGRLPPSLAHPLSQILIIVLYSEAQPNISSVHLLLKFARPQPPISLLLLLYSLCCCCLRPAQPLIHTPPLISATSKCSSYLPCAHADVPSTPSSNTQCYQPFTHAAVPSIPLSNTSSKFSHQPLDCWSCPPNLSLLYPIHPRPSQSPSIPLLLLHIRTSCCCPPLAPSSYTPHHLNHQHFNCCCCF
jgi:hypothetical protein